MRLKKNKPNQETPFSCFIYETKTKGGCGKVIGEFVCDEIITISYTESSYLRRTFTTDKPIKIKETCLTPSELDEYAFDNKGILELPTLYGWHISDLKIYDKPKELSEFRPICKFEGKDAICDLFCPNWKYDGGLFFECTRKVDRPPQSWCYVEEV